MTIFLLDNFDSFTYNLYNYLLCLDAEVIIRRNTECTTQDIIQWNPDKIILSPGPKRPTDAGIMMDLIAYFYDKKPILGVCLGHQALGEFFGAKLVKAKEPMHGKTSKIYHSETDIFKNIPNPTEVMRYHSLILEDLPPTLLPTATTTEGELMAFSHQSLPIFGVQFHPESILSPDGMSLLKNWLYET